MEVLEQPVETGDAHVLLWMQEGRANLGDDEQGLPIAV
jgi:hypothetical protein